MAEFCCHLGGSYTITITLLKWEKWPKNGEKKERRFSPFLGYFSHVGPRAISFFGKKFSHFRVSAPFPFYTRRPDSQLLNCFGIHFLDECTGNGPAPLLPLSSGSPPVARLQWLASVLASLFCPRCLGPPPILSLPQKTHTHTPL